MKISIKIIKNENEFIANCPELDINCYGSDKSEAVRRIKKVISFYIDSAKELGFDVATLNAISVDGEEEQAVMRESASLNTQSIN
jgi:predicted RNase H-like HicB family nuclease